MDKWGKYGAMAAIVMAGLAAAGLLLDVVKGPPQIIVTVEDSNKAPSLPTAEQAPKTPEIEAPATAASNDAGQTQDTALIESSGVAAESTPSASGVQDASASGIWTDGHRFKLIEGTTATVCPDATSFRFSVAKQGSQAAQAIYYRVAGSDRKAETGTVFLLADQCQLRLERTGKTTDFFAEFTYMETTE